SHVEHSLILVREYAGRQRRAAFYKPARGAASPPSQLKPPTAVAITATMISRRRRRKSNACERIMRCLPSPDSPGPRRSVDRVERTVSHVLRARSSLEQGTGGRPRLRPPARSVPRSVRQRQRVPLPAAVEGGSEQGRCDNERAKGDVAIRHRASS